MTDTTTPSNLTVLVVEDQDSIRLLLSIMLKRKGFSKVLEADTVEKGLAALEGHRTKIDLVISDCVLPDGHGRQIAQKVLEMRKGQRADQLLPIIMMSATIEDARSVDGSSLVLEKPFGSSDIAPVGAENWIKTLRALIPAVLPGGSVPRLFPPRSCHQ